MSKFKVGDIIKGNEKSDGDYHITNSRMTKAKVVKVNVCNNPEEIKIEILEHESGKYIGNRYDVCDKCFDLVERENETIVIYRKGNEVIALDKSNGNKAVAKCSPDDTFDFNVGARIAFDRLTGVKPFEPKESNNGNFTMLCIESTYVYANKGKLYRFVDGSTKWDNGDTSGYYKSFEEFVGRNPVWEKKFVEVKEVKRKAKTGEYILVVDSDNHFLNEYKNGDVLHVERINYEGNAIYEEGLIIYDKEYVVLEGYTELQDFKPHLELNFNNKFYGEIGKLTKMVDEVGRKLYVGDVVELYNSDGKFITDVPVVECDGKMFVMGIEVDCKSNGNIERFKVIKKSSYDCVKHNAIIGNIKYVKVDEQ